MGKEVDLRDVRLTGAKYVETRRDGTTQEWKVLVGGQSPGSVGFHLTADYGSRGKSVCFHHETWRRTDDAAACSITFRRHRRNSGNPGMFPDQPAPEIVAVTVSWK